MQTEKFLINTKIVNYFIHGQPLSIKYEIPKAWIVVIKYENELLHNFERIKWFKKRYYLKRNKGVFENYTNAYYPKITFYCFGFGIWKIVKNFKVNFVNVKLPDLEIKLEPVKPFAKLKIKKASLFFEINKIAFSKKLLTNNNFSIKYNKCMLNAYNDYQEFKQNYRTN